MPLPDQTRPRSARLFMAGALALPFATASAGGFHTTPFSDLMGNHIDSHLETRITSDSDGNPVFLSGRFYIIPIDDDGDGKPDIDEATGLEKWRHPRGAGEHGEDCSVIKCRVGWRVRGWPASAVFLSHSGVVGDDHPQWLLPREAIPQPGAPSHFHWITYQEDDAGEPVEGTTTDPRGPDQPAACNVAMAGQLEGDVLTDASVETIGEVSGVGAGQMATWSGQDVHAALAEASSWDVKAGAEGVECQGWVLELKPVGKAFAFQHSGELLAVYPSGFDMRTHLNIQPNYALVPGITAGGDGTGGGGGHGGGKGGSHGGGGKH